MAALPGLPGAQPLGAGSPRPSTGRTGSMRRLADFASFTRRQPQFAAGLVIVAASMLLALVGPLVAPYPPETALPGDALQPPSWSHWMGTDVSGMDVFSRVISAPRIDLTIALVSTA